MLHEIYSMAAGMQLSNQATKQTFMSSDTHTEYITEQAQSVGVIVGLCMRQHMRSSLFSRSLP